MNVSIHFKGEKPHKEHFKVIEMYNCPEDNELSIYMINGETVRYRLNEVSSFSVSE